MQHKNNGESQANEASENELQREAGDGGLGSENPKIAKGASQNRPDSHDNPDLSNENTETAWGEDQPGLDG